MGKQLPENWKMVKLGDVCKVVVGRTASRSVPKYWGTGQLWVAISDIKNDVIETTKEQITDIAVDELNMKPLEVGTLIFSFKLSIGKSAFVKRIMFTNEAIAGLIPHDPCILDSKYLRYCLMVTNTGDAHDAVKGKCLNQEKIKSLELILPPIDIQHRLVSILDEADSLIKLRKQADDKMKELVPALFDEMFGDPFSNERKWAVSSLDDIALDVQYGTSAKANENGEGIPVLRMNNLRYDGSLDLKDLKHTVLQDDEFDKYTVQYGDVLINRTNSRELVGKTAVWDKDYAYAFAGYLVRFRLDAKLANPFFVSSALNLPSGKKLLFSMAKPAVNMSNISASDMKRIKLAIPPVELQDKFAEQAREVVSNQEVISEARQKLDDLFNSLMDRCMNGEIC